MEALNVILLIFILVCAVAVSTAKSLLSAVIIFEDRDYVHPVQIFCGRHVRRAALKRYIPVITVTREADRIYMLSAHY